MKGVSFIWGRAFHLDYMGVWVRVHVCVCVCICVLGWRRKRVMQLED